VTLASGVGRVPGYRFDFHSGIQAPVEIREFQGARMSRSNLALNEPFLQALADETGGKVMNAERSEQLRETFVQIVTEFRSRYLLTYSPPRRRAGRVASDRRAPEGREGQGDGPPRLPALGCVGRDGGLDDRAGGLLDQQAPP